MKDTYEFNNVSLQLRDYFCNKKNFVEVPAQSRLSILAACEDPTTISTFDFGGTHYPLPQTGQMWLEYELLTRPEINGVFCQTTSYRNEPHPIEGRHDLVFPMFEFESRGNIEDLKTIETELLIHMGFDAPTIVEYEKACQKYNVDEIGWEEEFQLEKDFGHSILLEKFPLRTHPFWNMKHVGGNIFNKVDVILMGMETIGSAERSVDVEEMRDVFMSISGGEYSNKLFRLFGKNRVMDELDSYLSYAMTPRFGGGIGITRLARANKLKEKYHQK